MAATTLQPASALTANSDGGTSIAISWQPGVLPDVQTILKTATSKNVILAQFFRLLVRAQDEPSFRVVADGKDLLEHTCYNLQPVTKYHIYVDTYHLPSVLPGQGPRSPTITCTTGEAVPNAPPHNLRAVDTTLDSIKVEWEPPAATNGVIAGYKLFQGTRELLDPGTEYQFVVLAFTKAGDGPKTAPVVAETLESALSRSRRLQEAHGKAEGRRPTVRLLGTTVDSTVTDPAPTDLGAADPTPPLSRTYSFLNASAARATPNLTKGAVAGAREPVVQRASFAQDAGGAAYSLDNRPNWSELAKLRKASLAAGPDAAELAKAAEPAKSVYVHEAASQAAKHRSSLTERFNAAVQRRANGEDSLPDWSSSQSTPAAADAAAAEQQQQQQEHAAANDGKAVVPDNDPASDARSGLRRIKHNWTTKAADAAKREHGNGEDEELWNESAVAQILGSFGRGPAKDTAPRQSATRFITSAEKTGVPELIPTAGEIKSGKGSVRGKRNSVRSRLEILTGENYLKRQEQQLAFQKSEEEKKNRRLVLYITSNAIVRKTQLECASIIKLFEHMRLKVQKRDIYLEPGLHEELEERAPHMQVPVVFADGMLLGGVTEVLQMNEEGTLKEILKGFEVAPIDDCPSCGGAGYVTCSWCQGSKKSLRNNFLGEKGASNMNVLKCTACNELGLVRCDRC